MNGQGWAGITVFGHLGDGWAKSGTTWNVHDFAVTNIYTNGGVPLSPEPSWQTYNVYRSRPYRRRNDSRFTCRNHRYLFCRL